MKLVLICRPHPVKGIILLTLSQFISITFVYVRYAFLPYLFFKENKKLNLSSHSLREQNLLMSFCTKKRQLFGPCCVETGVLFHQTAKNQNIFFISTVNCEGKISHWSATHGVTNGGADALIEWPDGGELEVRTPAGSICSSFRAEMLALLSALSHLRENPAHVEDPIVVCTDSHSALASLREGPATQSSPLGIGIWRTLKGLSEGGRQIVLQWVPTHCGLRDNERADTIAKEASSLDQTTATVDVRTAHRAAARLARTRTIQAGRPGGTACLWARASPARRRRRQAGRGRRPPVESRPLDPLYPVATQGPAGALPAVR